MRTFLNCLRSWFFEKCEVNYLYFSIFFVVLTTFSLSHFLFLEQPLFGIRLFFLLYAIGQVILEVWGFVFIAYLLKRYAPRWTFFTFISFSFILLLLHFTNFTLLRIMDLTVLFLIKFLFGRGFEHLYTAMLAINLNLWMTALTIFTLLFVPFAGLLLYGATSHIAKWKPWRLAPKQVAFALVLTVGSLLCLDFFIQPYLDRFAYNKLHRHLPFGDTFFSPTPKCISLPQPIAKPRDEKEVRKQLPVLTAISKPNIYFFIIETLRRDYITEEIAPCLNAFAKKNIDFLSSFANANWTSLSWFAIFQSHFPYNWTAIRDTWKEGSIPLQLFKQLGYKILVYSSADLRYFNMDRTIFGENKKLADHIEEFAINRNLEACERDALCIDSFSRDICTQKKEGNFYIFFLDATHSEYNFPKNFPLKFAPSAKQIDYLTITPKEIEPVKNRYRNSVAYIDSLMDRFFQILEKENLYEEAVIAITGDHGEEFYEEGALFHGSHINRYQTEVPIFCKFPNHSSPAKEATHIDLFPSLLHYISGKSDFGNLFDGTSIFAQNRWPYRMAVMQNGSDTPVEFSIANRTEKVHFRFLYPYDIYNQTELEVIALETDQDQTHSSEGSIHHIIDPSFPNAIAPLLRKNFR